MDPLGSHPHAAVEDGRLLPAEKQTSPEFWSAIAKDGRCKKIWVEQLFALPNDGWAKLKNDAVAIAKQQGLKDLAQGWKDAAARKLREAASQKLRAKYRSKIHINATKAALDHLFGIVIRDEYRERRNKKPVLRRGSGMSGSNHKSTFQAATTSQADTSTSPPFFDAGSRSVIDDREAYTKVQLRQREDHSKDCSDDEEILAKSQAAKQQRRLTPSNKSKDIKRARPMLQQGQHDSSDDEEMPAKSQSAKQKRRLKPSNKSKDVKRAKLMLQLEKIDIREQLLDLEDDD